MRSSIRLRTESGNAQSNIERYKRELGRAFVAVPDVRIYHSKQEILIRWGTEEIRYFPTDMFRIQYKSREFLNVSVSDLVSLVTTGTLRGTDVS